MAVGGLITKPTRLVAITSASSTLGTVTDLRAVTKLAHEVGGLWWSTIRRRHRTG